ncbi:MAG: GAF domain-containing protein [Thermoplasmata archaeon]|nr:MAG: GAF domain-containing protein [Thermoplasmata archaeon]
MIEGIICDITKERLYRRKLEILAEVSTSLLGEIEMDALYNTTLRAILKAMDADGGVIFEMKENELHLRKAIKMSREYRKKYKTVKMGEHLVGKVAKTKEPILVFDSLQDKRATVAVIKSEGYRSAIVVPILLEDQVLGSIGVISRKPHHFTEADIDTLQTMANSLASAMRVASMHQQVVKALQEEKEFKMKTAHYFFNPIAIAKGYLELAMEEKDGKDKILKAIEAINRVEKVVKNVTQRGEIRE